MPLERTYWTAYELVFGAPVGFPFWKRVVTGTLWRSAKAIYESTGGPNDHQKPAAYQVMLMPHIFAEAAAMRALTDSGLTFTVDNSDVENTNGNVDLLIDHAHRWVQNYLERNSPIQNALTPEYPFWFGFQTLTPTVVPY
jgi:hypothetical protein